MDNIVTYLLLICIGITVIIMRRDTKKMRPHIHSLHKALNHYIEKEKKHNV
jgi:hypothetical protein